MPAVARNDEIGTSGHGASQHLIIVGIVENGGLNGRRVHQRGQFRVAIHNLFDAWPGSRQFLLELGPNVAAEPNLS